MPSSPVEPSTNVGLDFGFFTIPQSLILQIGTLSMLTVLVAQKATTQTMEAIGEASEELFRGERLPILDFPESDGNRS